MTICFLALGSNLDDPITQVSSAITEISATQNCKVLQQSSLYQNPSLIAGQPDFINAVVKINCTLTPLELLVCCKNIEKSHHRIHYYHWGPRTLDIDILLYGNITLHTEKLIIPHPEMWNRNFVLKPLAEIEPNLKMPNGKALKNHLLSQS